MTTLKSDVLRPSCPTWPPTLTQRLGRAAPTMLHAIGPVNLLGRHKVALFCSVRTLGEVILRAYDAARRMRDAGVTVISGFQSPIEKECLKILLRGTQPIISCPGRAIESMRIPADCCSAFDAGRILFLSPFTEQPKRVTMESAFRRNEVVAALANEAYVAHMERGGKTDQLVKRLTEWKVPMVSSIVG